MREKKPKSVNHKCKRGDNNKPWKSRESSETILRNYIPINLRILKKWTNL
jgi:hypothetical protein